MNIKDGYWLGYWQESGQRDTHHEARVKIEIYRDVLGFYSIGMYWNILQHNSFFFKFIVKILGMLND